MKLLGIETSGEAVSIAVWRDGVVDLRRVGGGATPSETLIPDIMALLRAHALTLLRGDEAGEERAAVVRDHAVLAEPDRVGDARDRVHVSPDADRGVV